jgi:diguanylate cyclase (GGDEF)-like protein
VPLLVGGEVIGAVLTSHADPLHEEETRRLRESVRQAAPVVANLRNLAISQMRAATDALTGLPNRRALDFTLKRMVAQASRTRLPVAALMVDIDHFKQINDQLGHSKGDEILAAVGALLEDTLRASDFAARYGGEEFLVLLPATDTAGALALAEKIRDALHRPLATGVDRTVTASIGVAVVPDHALDAEGLVRAADRALYRAKTKGRDRIEAASPDTVPRPEKPTDLDALISG